MSEIKTYSIDFGGREMKFTFNKLAAQANGAVICQYGDSTLLATAVLGRPTDLDYLPLSIEYVEKYYAAGKIKSSRFDKRERMPSDDAILVGRMIDRGLRPLFPGYYRNEMQVMMTTLSYDGKNMMDVVAANAASLVCMISDLPFEGHVASIRVGYIDGQYIANPTPEQLEKSSLSLFISVNNDNVVMIEAGANEVSEKIMIDGIEFAKKELKPIVEFFKKIQKEIGKEKLVVEKPEINNPAAIVELSDVKHVNFIEEVLYDMKKSKRDRIAIIEGYESDLVDKIEEMYEDAEQFKKEKNLIKDAAHAITKKVLRKNILEKERRIDDRTLDDLRPLSAEVGIIPRMHGTGLFQRGETQCLSVLTLGSPSDVQLIDDLNSDERKKKYIHHYNFPPYSTGDVSFRLAAGRREIGHGALAEKALIPVLPDDKENPYTIHIVSEIMASNGSTSQAAICGSTLALMDAGIKIKKPVGGIAMGLMSSEDGSNIKVLTDIQDYEDFCGDMDFKVAGTRDGITAIQMDTKISGLTYEVMTQALEKARIARMKIIDTIESCIAVPREEMSPYAPRIITMQIKPEDVRIVIGKRGENINRIIDTTGVTIDLDDTGLVHITSTEGEAADKAIAMIKALVFTPEVGDIFEGKITRKLDFGLIVEFAPNKDGMVHISEIADTRTENLDAFTIGGMVKVKLIAKSPEGKYSLSIKQVK